MQIFGRLADVLADLYPDPEDAKRIVDQAGLVPEQVDFSGPAIRVWFNVLVEAEKHVKTVRLLSTVRDEYPKHRGLSEAFITYVEDKTMSGERPTRLPSPYGGGYADGEGSLYRRVEALEQTVHELSMQVAQMAGMMKVQSGALIVATLIIATVFIVLLVRQ